MERKIYQHIAHRLQAMTNCKASGNDEWFERHRNVIEDLVKEHMPSGSGFDNGTTLDFGASGPDRLVFITSFHHMHESGMYDGWTEHTVFVTPSLAGEFNLRITGRDRNEIKDNIHEAFDTALRIVVDDAQVKSAVA